MKYVSLYLKFLQMDNLLPMVEYGCIYVIVRASSSEIRL